MMGVPHFISLIAFGHRTDQPIRNEGPGIKFHFQQIAAVCWPNKNRSRGKTQGKPRENPGKTEDKQNFPTLPRRQPASFGLKEILVYGTRTRTRMCMCFAFLSPDS